MIQFQTVPRIRRVFEENIPELSPEFPSDHPELGVAYDKSSQPKLGRMPHSRDIEREVSVSPAQAAVDAPAILIVDDEPSFVRLMNILLTMNNYTVVPCSLAQNAAAMARQYQPQIILLDLHMPHIEDGRWLLQVLRHDPRTKNIPIIITSADPRGLEKYADELTRDSVAQLVKPFDLERLLTVIRETLASASETDGSPAVTKPSPAEPRHGS